ncbi:hypothetical protein ACN42_g5856 [Penicillium freii]|uniref:Uncharacterized protein n=1 Tax=Penicillium freii TaxID=48697 RepID=A0A117NNR4_PENFR|nr:hypothetical protein ACN42_g5856 [Penicillium freii]
MASDEKSEEHTLLDFSCRITIKNESEQNFGLVNYGINGGYGVWPEGQPPNTIEACSEGTVHLKDPPGLGGSDGWVQYGVPSCRARETFTLSFECPQSYWSSNKLKALEYNPNVLDINIQPYDTSGHPLQVSIKGSKKPFLDVRGHGTATKSADLTAVRGKTPLKTNYDIGFKPINKPPVHETILIAAFMQSDVCFPVGTVYTNLNNKQWEYMRGVVWNDDPSCYLFEDYSDKNHVFSTGYCWYQAYSGNVPGSIIRRSHFGDLQFLHGMASVEGEKATDTQRKILTWLEVMYRLACGDQGVSDSDLLRDRLGEWFNDKTIPPGGDTLRNLILASTPNYNCVDLKKRALGICLHIITDSYAVGHTQRRLTNPDAYQGPDDHNYMVFKEGMYGKWGPVVAFHSYDGQNQARHSHYDGLENGNLPVPKNLDSFNSIIGARSAIEADKKFMNCFAAQTKWEDGVENFLKSEVFAIDKDAKPANSLVDEGGPYTGKTCHKTPQADCDYLCAAGLQRKILNLESGTYGPPTLYRRRLWREILFGVFILAIALICFVLSLVYFH